MKKYKSIVGVWLFSIFSGCMPFCQERVPAGYLGRTQEPSGFSDEILVPGNHDCWGRCNLYLIETTDKNVEIPMDVLCRDSLNFKFTIDLLVSLDTSNVNALKQAFEDLKPVSERTITVEQLFETYIKPQAAQEAQKVISKYHTSEIVEKRASIIEEVSAAVILSADNSLIKVKRVALSDLDFPDVVTKAQEAKAERNVQIETAKAEGEIAMAKGRALLRLAELEAQKKLLDAQAIADANKIVASSISPNYLAYEQIQAMTQAGKGDNNVFFYPYENAMHKGINTSDWVSPEILMDAALLKKLEAAKEEANKELPLVLPGDPELEK